MRDATTDNPLLNWIQLPAYDQIEPEHVEPAVRVTLEQCEGELRELEEGAPTTWDDLLPGLERIEDKIRKVWGVVSHLHNVRNSPELREVYQRMQPHMVAFYNRFGQSKPVFEALCILRESAEWDTYTSAQKRIVEAGIRDARLTGVGLEGAQRERFNAIATRLADLSTRFSNNVLDATKNYALTLKKEEELAGLPPSLLALAAETARLHGHEDATPEAGPWVITLELPSYGPFMDNSRRRDLREQLYRAYVTRASEGDLDNKPLVDEILKLRQEQAELLGFETFADMSLSRKMAPSVTAVDHLLKELREAARPAGQQDLADLRTLARAAEAPEAAAFELWDVRYWAERLREKRYDLREEELRPYFPLPRVLAGMFGLVEQLFGVQIVEDHSRVPVWHPDVQYFHVVDEAGGQTASFFLDPYSRPAEKRGGAWMDMLVGRSKVMAPPGKKVRLPVAYMCCNQSPPVGDKPSLMTFREVLTLFHEFGHALQHMLTTVDEGLASGLSNVEWDAVELASQFMENWCYHRPTLLGMARHYETEEPLPDEIVERLRAARSFRAGYKLLRQLNFGLYDMALHAGFDADGPETPHTVQQRIWRETMILPPLPDDYFFCSFAHIFAGSYAAGYYSYKWAEVLSADAFAAFEEAGLDDGEAVQALGRRFRDTVLALGGSRHPMTVFKAFRGREPSTEPLLRRDGLIAD